MVAVGTDPDEWQGWSWIFDWTANRQILHGRIPTQGSISFFSKGTGSIRLDIITGHWKLCEDQMNQNHYDKKRWLVILAGWSGKCLVVDTHQFICGVIKPTNQIRHLICGGLVITSSLSLSLSLYDLWWANNLHSLKTMLHRKCIRTHLKIIK